MRRASSRVPRVALVAILALILASCSGLLGFEDFTAQAPSLAEAGTDAGDGAAPIESSVIDANDEQVGADAAMASALTTLSVSIGSLSPPFSPTTLDYTVRITNTFAIEPFTVTATAAAGSAITIANVAASSGKASAPLPIDIDNPTSIDVTVGTGGQAPQHYTILVTNAPDFAYLKASNAGFSTGFGRSVAMSGDTLVVGADQESSNAQGINGDQTDTSADSSGAAYVFTRAGATWVQQAYIKASNSRAGAHFGQSVAIEGDTLAVGANNESSAATGINGNQSDTSAESAGAVYVFRRTGTTWAQEAYLKASNTHAEDNFGTRIALSGNSLAVGAYGESSRSSGINGDQSDTSSKNAGAVYVYTRQGTAWKQEAYVKASLTDSSSFFGDFVALDGDTLAVGAIGERWGALGINGSQSATNVSSTGAVYVLTRVGTTWTQQAFIRASVPTKDFGAGLALDGNTLAVGTTSTAAYVFTRAGTTWSQQAILAASNGTPDDSGYGVAIALLGDTLAIGDFTESSAATGVNGDQTSTAAKQSGAVYVYKRSATTWTQQAYVKPTNTVADRWAGFWFGLSVAISGDSLFVGAPEESSIGKGVNGLQMPMGQPGSGAVYVFR